MCLVEGSLNRAKELLKAKKAIGDIESVMGYGAAYLYFSFENNRRDVDDNMGTCKGKQDSRNQK